jgi:Phosphotransferase enzyme family
MGNLTNVHTQPNGYIETSSTRLSSQDQQPEIVDLLISNDSLPTLGEIEATGRLLFQQGNHRVHLLPNNTVVKYGPHILIEEAATLQFLNTNMPDLLAPHLYGVRTQYGPVLDKDGYTGHDTLQTCIFMSYIPGESLAALVPTMDEATMSEIACEIKMEVDKLRSLPPEGYIGSVNRGQCLDVLFRPVANGARGPFESEEAMNEYLINFLYPKGDPAFKYRMLGLMNAKQCDIYFTHGDLAPRNILIKDGHLAGIVDWAMAGWYPEYWEFARACWHHGKDDWYKYIEKIVTPDYTGWVVYLQLTR